MKTFLVIALILVLEICSNKKGIDVSKWQGSINWEKVAKVKSFAIIKAGSGNGHIDEQFEKNYKNAKSAGVPIGAYWYSYADSGSDGKTEAKHAINALKGKKFEYPIYIDIEEKSIFKKGIASSVAKNFCEEMQSKKYYCGIYSSKSYFDSYFDSESKKKYSIWVAQWSSKCTYKGSYGIWQYSSNGSVDGISGRVDLDEAYEDFPSIIKKAHLNGY